MSNFEDELDRELRRVLDPIADGPVPARRLARSRSAARTIAGGAGAALGLKILTGVAVAAATVTVAGAATTGSLNPVNWGQQVKQHVQDCRDQLADGQHGIGDCVSAFASEHGTAVASDARHHGNPNPQDSANSGSGNGNANGHDKDKTKGKPTNPRAGSTTSSRLEPEPTDEVIRSNGSPPPPVP